MAFGFLKLSGSVGYLLRAARFGKILLSGDVSPPVAVSDAGGGAPHHRAPSPEAIKAAREQSEREDRETERKAKLRAEAFRRIVEGKPAVPLPVATAFADSDDEGGAILLLLLT